MFLIRSLMIAGLALICATSTLFADVSVSDQQDLVLRTTYDKVCDFIEKHPNEIIRSSHNEIIERDGTKVKLRNKNKQEVIIFTVQEKNKRGLYGTEMTKCHQGGLTAQSTEIKVSVGNKGKAMVSIKTSATIDNPNIGAFEAKVEVNKSTKGIKEYLKKSLE